MFWRESRRKSVVGLRSRQRISPGGSILESLEDRKLLSGMAQALELHQPAAEVHTLAQAHKTVHKPVVHAPAHKAAHKPSHKTGSMAGMPGMAMPNAAPSAPALVNGVVPGTGGTYVSGLPLTQPQDLYSKNGVLNVTLTVSQQVVNVSGKNVYAIVYNGSFVGPTLHLSPGDTLKLNLVNKSDQPTNIHFHGLHVSPSGNSDNIFLSTPVAGSTQYVVNIPKTEPLGVNWYHSHQMGYSESQVFGGLSGMIVIDGLKKKMPTEYSGIKEVTIGLKDLQVDATGAIVQTNIDSNAPTQRTVNGLVNPVLTIAPGETQLWHVANIGADIYYDLSVGGQSFTVVAEDGQQVWKPYSVTHLVMLPGKRFDILVKGSASGTVTQVNTLPFSNGPAGDQYPLAPLLQLVSTGAAVKTLTPLTTGLCANSDLTNAKVAAKRTFVFSQDNVTDLFYIDGQLYNSAVTNVLPKLGTVEEWTLSNIATELHPFHLHTNKFQVMSINGVPYKANGWQDAVDIPAGGNVVVRTKFADYIGKSVFHCHILHHEEQGMMRNVQVV